MLLPIIRIRLFLRNEVVPVLIAGGSILMALILESSMLHPTWAALFMLMITSGVLYVFVLWFSIKDTAHLAIIKEVMTKAVSRLKTW